MIDSRIYRKSDKLLDKETSIVTSLYKYKNRKIKDFKISQKLIDECSNKLAISHKYKFIFIHSPKTGGSSIRRAFEPFLDGGYLRDENNKKLTNNAISEEDIKKYKLKAKNNNAFHLRLTEQRKMVPKEIWDSYFKFVFVRNPWDYAVSYYAYKKDKARKKKIRHPEEYQIFESSSFREVCRNLDENLSDYYMINNKKIGVDYIGKLETIEDDFKYICKKLGLPKGTSLPHANRSEHKHYSEYYDKELKEFVEDKYKDTISLFGYDFEKNPQKDEERNESLTSADWDRVKYYLGDIPEDSEEIKISKPEEKLSCYDLINPKYYKKRFDFTWKVVDEVRARNVRIRYGEPLMIKLIKYHKTGNFFLWQPMDIVESKDDYVLSKIRQEGFNKVTILRFNPTRHWELVYDKPKERTFEEKEDKIIWRGATTGYRNKVGSRFDLVTKYFEKRDDIDVAFTKMVGEGKEFFENDESSKRFFKFRMSPEEMLKFKYIISVEGNDKDSGINWKLNSNSVVLMTKPRKFSWLMEEKLIPNKHYILLQDDFSDLEEKLEWCRKNQDKCRQIIKNAHEYMEQFLDLQKEMEIEKEVIEQYFDRMKVLGIDARQKYIKDFDININHKKNKGSNKKNIELQKEEKDIAIFHDYFRVLGGAERLIIDLASNLKADIVTSEIKDNILDVIKSKGINVISLGEQTKEIHLLSGETSRRFMKCNLKNRYNMYIFSGSFSIYAAKNHKPNIWYCHTPLKGIYHD